MLQLKSTCNSDMPLTLAILGICNCHHFWWSPRLLRHYSPRLARVSCIIHSLCASLTDSSFYTNQLFHKIPYWTHKHPQYSKNLHHWMTKFYTLWFLQYSQPAHHTVYVPVHLHTRVMFHWASVLGQFYKNVKFLCDKNFWWYISVLHV